jgi:hypothetical protein
MDKARVTFKTFCGTMEKEVKWVNDLVRHFNSSSLDDLILEIHEEYECDLIFGDLAEWENIDEQYEEVEGGVRIEWEDD